MTNMTEIETHHTGQHEQKTGISMQAAEIVNHLFADLQAIFPAWRCTFPDHQSLEKAKKVWVKGLLENHISTLQQIRLGLRNARKSGTPYIPSLGQFISWCSPTPEEFGLPDERNAYQEACRKSHDLRRGGWSHPAVYIAGRETGFFTLKTRPEKETYPVFKRNYEIVCRRAMAGEDFQNEIPKALPKTSAPRPAARNESLHQLQKLRASIGLRNPS